VGGALRDQILGRAPVPDEWDIATSARPDDVMKIFPRCVPTGIAHGTVTVLLDDHKAEVTTFRQEGGYTDARHPDSVKFLGSIEEDLARRDFTINAMAYDPLAGHFVDPYGGMEDLKSRLVKTVGDPAVRFGEDGLRPLRGARFVAVLGFRMERATFEAMEGVLQSFLMVSAERKRDEIIKMMKAEKPSLGWEILRKARYIKGIFPEMVKMVGAPGGELHKYDVWNHSIMACDFCPGAWQVRLAALLHDIGKPFVEADQPESEVEASYDEDGEPAQETRKTFYRHQQAGSEIVQRWMERMRFSNEDIRLVARLIEHHMVLYSPEWSDAAVRRFIGRVGEDLLDDLFTLVESDIKARGTAQEALSLLNELKSRARGEMKKEVALAIKDLAVGGLDIMKHLSLDPGPLIGRILRGLLDRVIEDPSLNRRETLLRLAGEIKEKEQ